jgi:fatty acyl-CoA reductase
VAAAAHANNKETKIIHCGTSASNPVSWGYANKIVKAYWKTYPPQKKLGKCGFRLEKNDKLLKV